MTQTNPNAFVLYNGPSLLDGSPIIAIVTGLSSSSSNSKTGAMVQTWIIPRDVEPHTALKTGADASVCGLCDLRPYLQMQESEGVRKGSCYVTVFQAPLAVHRAYHRGSYGSELSLQEVRTRIGRVRTHTGYTRQWRSAHPTLSDICMASVFSHAEAMEASALGYRTFRTAPDGTGPAHGTGEATCPASKEGGFKATCETCGLCTGTTRHDETEGRAVRVGSYGDPAAVPTIRWRALVGPSEPFARLPADIVIRAHGPAHKVRNHPAQ